MIARQVFASAAAAVRNWRKSRAARHRAINHAAWDLSERYGAAASVIARRSSHQPAGAEQRRFWRAVSQALRPRGSRAAI
jgi:hypothetical protein